jgi:hypothetical protein
MSGTMKYYLYISDAKVDMLLKQIDEDKKKKIVTSLGFDLKVISAKRTVEVEAKENQIARLETVVSYIQKYGNIGSVDEPDQYIYDVLPMALNVVRDLDHEFSLMYLAGRTPKTVLGLAGSLKFMLGQNPETKAFTHSAAEHICRVLDREFDQPAMGPEFVGGELSAVLTAEQEMRGPKVNYEFVAKRLAYSPDSEGMGVLLATPIYIAMAD